LKSDEDDATDAKADKESDTRCTPPRDGLATPLQSKKQRDYAAEENHCTERVEMLQFLRKRKREVLLVRLGRYGDKQKNSCEDSGSDGHVTVFLV
jgi:hypothetical protein